MCEQLLDLVILLKFYEFEVGLHILLLESVESFLSLLVLDHFLLLLLYIVYAPSLVGQFLAIFVLLSVPFEKLLFVNSQVLHEFLVLDLFAAFVITLDLVFEFFNTVALISIFL